MKNLFVYGTLMFDEILQQLVKNRYQKIVAQLPGHVRRTIKGEDYPGVIPSPGSTVLGELVLDVHADDIVRLDEFEGEYYERKPVIIISGKTEYPAEAYIVKQQFQTLLSSSQWDPDVFRANGLSSFLNRYRYFLEQFP